MPSDRERVVVDTSAWVAFLRGYTSSTIVVSIVRQLIQAEAAMLVGPVVAELVQGARGQREVRTLAELTQLLPYDEATVDDWREVGETMRELRARGITLPFTDTLIAVMANRRGLPVLTIDRHFDLLPARQLPH